MAAISVHYGHPNAQVRYDWEGRSSFWGARAGSVLTRARRLADDPRATNIRVRINGTDYDPSDVKITGRRTR